MVERVTRLASPRLRRRLAWTSGALGAGLAAGLVILLVPSHGQPNPAPLKPEGPAQLATPTSTHVAAADRRAIDRALDRFIPAAVGRADAQTAWALAGPELRASTSLADWRAWNVPVPSYPVRGTTFHGWTTIDAGRDYVDFNLLVHPKPGRDLGDWVFDGQMVRRHGAWLVNRLYTIAIMHPVRGSKHEIGPADFSAPPPSGTPSGTARLGHAWLLAAVAIVGLVLLLPLAFGLLALERRRRWRKQIRAERRELPPLPPLPRRDDAPRERETAGRH